MRKFLCGLGIHKWIITEYTKVSNRYNYHTNLKFRQCTCCHRVDEEISYFINCGLSKSYFWRNIIMGEQWYLNKEDWYKVRN